ncbi:MAG: hypothetical protein Q9160_000195 [Pyrenula sp. 1 TL-2023]
MVARKRTREELDSSEPPQETGILERLRNAWEFACLMQYIFIFGKAVKIDEDFDIEDLETECLKPEPSEKLQEIGLTLLKWISSHRGLTYEIWDEYTRRQYLAKAPDLNPYGTSDEPKRFKDFDVFQKVRVLHQLSVWTLWNPDRMREKMPEQRESEQIQWRIEEVGYDRRDRQYYVLDDNRLYRRTEPPLPQASAARPKANTVKARAARRRASKRARLEHSATPDDNNEHQDADPDSESEDRALRNDDTFGGFKWECLAVNHAQYKDFLGTLEKTKDPDEKILRDNVTDNVLPVIEKAEEAQRRKLERKERELINLQKMAGAKRSSRLADKFEKEKQERDTAETERKRMVDLRAAQREQERQQKMDQDRESRMMTREQRIRDREYKRILREEELRTIEEEAKRVEAGESRGSERHLKAQMYKTKRDLEELEDEDDWTFDCSVCGVHGANLDDGTAIISCEKCNVWQHMKCLGISTSHAAKPGFTFLCRDCTRREEEAKRPKIAPLKFRVGTSSSPPSAKTSTEQQIQKTDVPRDGSTGSKQIKHVEIPRPTQQPPPHITTTNGYSHPNHITNASPQTNHVSAVDNIQSPSKSISSLPPNASAQHGPSALPHHHPPTKEAHPSPYVNGARPVSGHGLPQAPLPATTSLSPKSPPQHLQSNGPYSRPSSQGHQALLSTPRHHAPTQSVNSTPSSHFSSQSTSFNGLTANPRPTPIHSTNGPSMTKLPSPVQNRPSMSPTQGNPDVGPLAGFNARTSMSPPLQRDVDHLNGPSATSHQKDRAPTDTYRESAKYQPNEGITTPAPREVTSPTPGFLGQQQQPTPKSGLSPVKHSPNQVLMGSAHLPKARIVSGTLVFPPAETLQPSPEAARTIPIPTPMKDGNVPAPPNGSSEGQA